MSRKTIINFYMGMLIIVSISCIKEEEIFDPYAQLKTDVGLIKDSVAGINYIEDPSGVIIIIDSLGYGLPAPRFGDPEVTVGYKGRVFNNGLSLGKDTITQTLSRLIRGWGIALTSLPVGSTATVYIPSGYAYGNSATQTIPANSILVFDLFFESVTISSAVKEKRNADIAAIDTYLTTDSIVAQLDTTGIRYVILEKGEKDSLSIYDNIKLSITLKSITDPTKTLTSDTLDTRPVFLPSGIMRGLQYIREGGKATIYVPSGLGYGTNTVTDSGGQAAIPANTNLIVDVELLDIVGK